MQIQTKEVYISFDKKEFATEAECLAYEATKKRMSITNLTSPQIIGLLSNIYDYFYGSAVPTAIQVEIKKKPVGDWDGFYYRIKRTCPSHPELDEIAMGGVTGDNDFVHYILDKEELSGEKNDYAMSNGYSLRMVYDYLDRIGFWNLYDTQPIYNAELGGSGDMWVEIMNEAIPANPKVPMPKKDDEIAFVEEIDDTKGKGGKKKNAVK